MKLVADENIPASVVKVLRDDGHDIVWIRSESPGISDVEVMRFAHQKNRILLTYDKDFGELAVRDRIYPSRGIILLRIPQKNPDWIAGYIRDVIRSRQDWEGHFSVIEEERIRMRPLSQR
jgi:predicted nuclease of predicted toxin-antitoxin system